ncbi:ArsR/SmtB family transcription factor [Micromonosporaceae bacterium Da 78-11]
MTEGRTGQGGLRITDPRVMRALAHPARIEIVEYLNNTGAVVTATECAGLVGLSPSATSYHLRELAKYGLVEQAPSRGDGRERVWRSTGTGLRVEGDLAQPEAREAERALVDVYLTRDYNRLREWIARHGDEPGPWRDASTLTSTNLLVTVEELAALNEQVLALMEPYRMRERQADAPAESRKVAVSYSAFPFE